jgi:hypothetical protein
MRIKERKKRGSATSTLFYVLFGLILAAGFIFGVYFKVKDTVDSSSYHKRFFARDLALLVDSLHASNGDFVIKYDINIPAKMKLDFNLTPDRVLLTDSSDKPLELRTQTAFLFGYNNYVKIIPSGVDSNRFEFQVVAQNKSISFQGANVFSTASGGGAGGGGGGTTG